MGGIFGSGLTPNLSGFVPYTGAIGNVDLGANSITATSFIGNGTSLTGIPLSVSNSDGSLIISPTTGAVVGSINLGHTNAFSVRQDFADGTVSLPGMGFTSDTSTGFYRIGTGQIGVASSGVKVAEFDSTTATTGYQQDGALQVNTNWTTAGSNIKSQLKIANQNLNIFSVTSRPDFSRCDINLGNGTSGGYIIIDGENIGTNIPRLDINYDLAFLGDPNNVPSGSITNFRGQFSMVRLAVASSVSNQFASGAIGFSPSAWSGSTDITTNIYNDVSPLNGTNEMLFWRIYTQQNIALYTGNHLSIQINQPRTNPAYSGSVGINAPQTSTIQAHLDIYEDNPNRPIFRTQNAVSQTANIVELRDSSGGAVFIIGPTGTVSMGADLNTPFNVNAGGLNGISLGIVGALADGTYSPVNSITITNGVITAIT